MFKVPSNFWNSIRTYKSLQQYVSQSKQVVSLTEVLGTGRSKLSTSTRKNKKLTKEKAKTKSKNSCDVKLNQKKETKSTDIVDKCDVYTPHHSNAQFWRKISLAVVPVVLVTSFVVLSTRPEPPERHFVAYEYLYRRNKPFPWGNGQLTYFHSKHNFDPQEEEKRIDEEKSAKEGDDGQGQQDTKKQNAPSKDATAPPASEKEKRYKPPVDEKELKKALREKHAKEELERRRRRQEIERDHPSILRKSKPKENSQDDT